MLNNLFQMAERIQSHTHLSKFEVLDVMAPLPKIYHSGGYSSLSWETFPSWDKFCQCSDKQNGHNKGCYQIELEKFAANSACLTNSEAISPFDGQVKSWGQIHAYEEIVDRMLYEKGKHTTFYIADIFPELWNDMISQQDEDEEELVEFHAPMKQVYGEYNDKYWEARSNHSDKPCDPLDKPCDPLGKRIDQWVYVGSDEEFVVVTDINDFEFKNYHLCLCSDDKDVFEKIVSKLDVETFEKGAYTFSDEMLDQIVNNTSGKYAYCNAKKVIEFINITDTSYHYDVYFKITTKSIPLLKSLVAHVIDHLQGVNEFQNFCNQINTAPLWQIIYLDGPREWTDWQWRVCGPKAKTQLFISRLSKGSQDLSKDSQNYERKIKPVKPKKYLAIKEYEKQFKKPRNLINGQEETAYMFMMYTLLSKEFCMFLEKILASDRALWHWPSGKPLNNSNGYFIFLWKGKTICYTNDMYDEMSVKIEYIQTCKY